MRLHSSFVVLLFVVCAVCAKPTTTQDESNTDYVEDDYATNGNDDVGDEDDYGEDTAEENEEFIQPSIESKSLNIAVKEGANIDLPCDTKNAELHVIMWKKNNQTITQGKSIFGSIPNIVVTTNSTLQIKNIQESDAGDYTCVVVTSQTDNVNITHHVSIDAPPRIVSLTAKDAKYPLQAGDDIELTCKASGEPKPKIKWYFEHKYKGMEEEQKNDMISEGEDLIIENIGYDRTGYYRCLADNGSKKPAHKSIFIDVVHKPVVNIEKIYSNEKLHQLVCIVHATPVAKVRWEKDGKNIVNKHLEMSTEGHEHRIKFSNFHESDEGRYTCIATNDVGEDNYAVQIARVPEQPHLSTSKSHKPKEYTLEWVVHSHMPILESVISYKEKGQMHEKEVFGKVTHKTTKNDFTISHTFSDLKRGSYLGKMKAKNQFGWSMFSEETHFEITGSRHSNRNKHHGSHMKDNDVMNRAESHTEEKEPENQEDNVRTGSQLSPSGSIRILPSITLLYFTIILLRP